MVTEPSALTPSSCVCGECATVGRTIAARDEVSGEVFGYVTCSACGAQRLSPRPAPDAIGSYYPDSYASYTVRPDSWGDRLKRLIYLACDSPENHLGPWRAVLRALLRPLRGHTIFAFEPIAPRRVFEFGAATGNDLALFRNEGWQIAGCEPSGHARAIAAGRGITLQHATAEAATLEPCGVSCILINNVLEHTHDPASVLRKCWSGLVPGGSLVVIVPNHAGLAAWLFGAGWPGYDAPRHLWGFTPRSLDSAMQATGFLPAVVHPRVQALWGWRSALIGARAIAPVAAWRLRWARPLSLPLLAAGIVAAMFGYGDFMTLVAVKPRN